VKIEIEWKGEGVDEKGLDKATGKVLVEVDPKYSVQPKLNSLLVTQQKPKQSLAGSTNVLLTNW